LTAFSGGADTVRWSPVVSLTDSTIFNVKAFPSYTTDYTISMVFPTGCRVDTNILVEVNKVNADAGPDRELQDGASTILGGPYMSYGDSAYTYRWFPYQYINDTSLPTPTVNPPNDFSYYVEVT